LKSTSLSKTCQSQSSAFSDIKNKKGSSPGKFGDFVGYSLTRRGGLIKMVGHTRRNFLKMGLKSALAAGIGTSLFLGCAGHGKGKKSLDEVLSRDYYATLTKDWDPIYGPPLQWFSRYGGPGDFHGHIRGNASPGLDYDIPMFTPIVPMTSSYLRQRTRDWKETLYVMLADAFNPAYRVVYAHLEEAFLNEKFLISGDVMKYLGEGVRALGRGEIVALSGNSGLGPVEYRWVQPPHLHLSLYYINFKSNTMAYLDPEKHGIDGGKPVFWDGETPLDCEANKRLLKLELTLNKFKEELDRWPKNSDVEELKGQLIEYYHLLGEARGRKILDSRHFQDIRALLRSVTLEERSYRPGTRPYSMMLKILGYSTDENQKIILTLPFIAPGLEPLYRKAVYEEGGFFNLVPNEK
jgi:hypothetical protein